MANNGSGGCVPPVTQKPGYPAYPQVQQPPAYEVPGQTLVISTFGGPPGLNYLAQVSLFFWVPLEKGTSEKRHNGKKAQDSNRVSNFGHLLSRQNKTTFRRKNSK